ncbi:up-regulator of cell proliferation-like [Engystomops pustulosus]|uniref:up-regulator of cell proliferation-like n=1 Tax=Engystomops pustulosus TaxID=76066 RepID=UPI003AFA7C9D
MDPTERLRRGFQIIFQSNISSLEQEMRTLLHYSLQCEVLDGTENLRSKVQEVLETVLDGGEDACQELLDNLTKNQHLFPRILHILNMGGNDKAMFKLLAEDLGLGQFVQDKLTLSKVQSIICEEPRVASCRSMKDIPMSFLRHLMALNVQEAFRSLVVNHDCTLEQDTSGNISGSVHPFDVFCCLLHCSDNFLRQEIISRMSMWRVPVPLLLPPGEEPHSTFLLWAMRGITKSNSSALTEDCVVDMSLPVFSFVSLGDYRYTPIAKIINQILSPNQQRDENELWHRATSWDDAPRCISDGLVEISWFFPPDQGNLGPLEKPFAMMNLHGDLQSNIRQLQFLTRVSSGMFIFMENVTRQQWDLVLHSLDKSKNYYFIFQDQITHFYRPICLDENVLLQSDEKFHEKLLFILKETIQSSDVRMTLGEMSVEVSKLNFCCDENQTGCEYGRLQALDLINDVVEAKIIDKDLTKMAKMTHLQQAFTYLSTRERQYFLKWMQFQKLSSGEAAQEDVLRMIGQMYEASRTDTARLCKNFPKAAVDLLLQGFPLELIDGDTNSIHLRWVSDVLSELNTKTKGKCRMKVISVLGVQGTGKSTLMNTMFGLQFPVGCRQTTHGALMSLIKVDEKDLGCDYLVVIDCEGFRALDNASVEESYEHDNELATLVVGLSDFAVINMALGSTSEMQNILQIVVHALMRMKGNGQKPSCVLVYQTMEGGHSEDDSMREDGEMLHLGAHINKSSNFFPYNDTIEFRILEDVWIIPPFDLKTTCYSEKVIELRKHLLQMIKYQSELDTLRNVQTFAEDIRVLWNSVKQENFFFRFKNILERDIYTELYERFLELEWNLCKKMHRWWVHKEDQLLQQPSGDIEELIQDVLRMLNEEAKMIEDSLQVYFTDSSENTNSYITKRFEDEFREKMQSLKSHLETEFTDKCLQKRVLQLGLAGTIVNDFIQECGLDEATSDPERYWKDSVTKYVSAIEKYHNVEEEFLQLLRKDMMTKGIPVIGLHCNDKYINKSWVLDKCNHMENCEACKNKRNNIFRFLLEKSSTYVQTVVESKRAYNAVYGMTLLKMVNDVICEDTMPYTVLFELDLKLYILAQSAPHFQKMHDDFLRGCKACCVVNQEKARVLHNLRGILHDKRVLQSYCQNYLKLGVEQKVKKMFKEKLINDYAGYVCTVMRSRQNLMRCGHHPPVDDTAICSRFTEENEIRGLLTNLVSSVIQDIVGILNRSDVLESGNIENLVASVWSVLDEERSSVRGDISGQSVSIKSLNIHHCAYHLEIFVRELEIQFQEELISKLMREHFMECPCLVWRH